MREARPLTERLIEFQALRTSGLGVKAAARRMGVSTRSGSLYEQKLRQQTGTQPPGVASGLRGPVLALLRAYPNRAFSACDLARHVQPGAKALTTNRGLLPRLVAQGLIEVVDGVRSPSDRRPVRRYRLAPMNDPQINTEREAN